MPFSKTEWSLRFARPRIRWLALMTARVAVMLAVVAAILYCWDHDTPWSIVAFLIVVLAILFAEALACDRRRAKRSRAAAEAGHSLRRRRETDL